MGATRAQWEALLTEIEQARNQRLDSDEQIGVYYRHLADIPFERARKGVEHLIKHYKGYQFPSVATIREHCERAIGEGTPNAIGRLDPPGYTPWHMAPGSAYAIWHQDQIEHMRFPVPLADEPDGDDRESVIERAERRYAAYVYNENGYRDECERVWRQMWAEGQEVTA